MTDDQRVIRNIIAFDAVVWIAVFLLLSEPPTIWRVIFANLGVAFANMLGTIGWRVFKK